MPPFLRDLYLIITISWIFYSPYCLESVFYFYYCRMMKGPPDLNLIITYKKEESMGKEWIYK